MTLTEVYVLVDAFNTERNYDFLTIGGTRYSGTDGPPSAQYSGVISRKSDSSMVASGWNLCGFD